MKDLNNTVVLSLNPEHGAEVIKAWKALGHEGAYVFYKENDVKYIGIVDNHFVIIAQDILPPKVKILTLSELQAMAEPQLTFPREMMVSNDNRNWGRRKVIGFLDGRYATNYTTDTLYMYHYAREIE